MGTELARGVLKVVIFLNPFLVISFIFINYKLLLLYEQIWDK